MIDKVKNLVTGIKSKSLAIPLGILILVAVVALVALFPLLLCWGLSLMGFPVEISTKSYLGAVLVYFFLRIASANTNKND